MNWDGIQAYKVGNVDGAISLIDWNYYGCPGYDKNGLYMDGYPRGLRGCSAKAVGVTKCVACEGSNPPPSAIINCEGYMKEKLTSITCHDRKCMNNSKGKCIANEIVIGMRGRCKSFADTRNIMFNNGVDLSSQ